MLFNSLQYLAFFPLVVLLYWVLPPKGRNVMLLISSYYFYMNWEPIYALLILLSTLTTWGCGIMIDRDSKHKKIWLVSCLVLNFGILFLFKYFNFITTSVTGLLEHAHIKIYVPTFTLLLPVGISFYTFQAVSYIIDIYRNNLKPERSLATYALFVSFFPQLVAGPIERAGNLLPQFHVRHRFSFELMRSGLVMMLWGYFMKLCIAEPVASYVDAVYNNVDMHSGSSVWLATFFFTFQIFCDFGGYSLIAIGTARCMGFTLMQNFNQPYLASSIQEFWRRWHISLTTWFTDYVYKPLGGSRCSTAKHQSNLLATFLLSGLWHGANWTFVIWGGYNGILLSMLALRRKYLPKLSLRQSNNRILRWIGTVGGVIVTFVLAMVGWSMFRANNVHDMKTILYKLAHPGGILYNGEGKPALVLSIILIFLLMLREARNELKLRLTLTTSQSTHLSALFVAMLLIVILLCARFESGQFIYFQF